MKMPISTSFFAGIALVVVSSEATAQWAPGSEVIGQSIQVTTKGVTNSIRLNPGGQAEIITPGGNMMIAAWTASNGRLCLHTGVAQECWAYTSAFQAGQPITLTSSCGTSTWLANAVNQPPEPPAPPPQGERG